VGRVDVRRMTLRRTGGAAENKTYWIRSVPEGCGPSFRIFFCLYAFLRSDEMVDPRARARFSGPSSQDGEMRG
jgi:hypothetical protein